MWFHMPDFLLYFSVMKKRWLFLLLIPFLLGNSLRVENAIPPGLVITPLTNNFYVFTTWQTYKDTRFPANGLYAVTDSGVVLIDSPWDSLQTKPLLDSIEKKHNKKVKFCIATHHHDDRTGGFRILKRNGVATWSSKLTYDWCVKKNEQKAGFRFTNDTVFTLGNLKIQTFYPGPGHAADNIVIWFEKEKILYGGCFIKSCEATTLGNLADADTQQWPVSVAKIQKKFPKRNFVIPGHQNWKNKKSLEHTSKLLKKYSNQKK
jgi:metallo-beta-lactamase class B